MHALMTCLLSAFFGDNDSELWIKMRGENNHIHRPQRLHTCRLTAFSSNQQLHKDCPKWLCSVRNPRSWLCKLQVTCCSHYISTRPLDELQMTLQELPVVLGSHSPCFSKCMYVCQHIKGALLLQNMNELCLTTFVFGYRMPNIGELSLYDVVGTPGVAADVSHMDSKPKVMANPCSPCISDVHKAMFYAFTHMLTTGHESPWTRPAPQCTV